MSFNLVKQHGIFLCKTWDDCKTVTDNDQALWATSNHDRTFLHSEHCHVLIYDTPSLYHVE